MNYIDLDLKKVDKYNNIEAKNEIEGLQGLVTLDKVIQQNKINILIGAPGSGKTSLFKKYCVDYDNTQLVKVKQFLKRDNLVNNVTTTLLLDGLDEYRNLPNSDKSSVVEDLAFKISKLNNISDVKIVISCRELDWYGQEDIKALKDELKSPVAVYEILNLDYKKQNELLTILGLNDKESFFEKFSSTGFLSNPQMLNLITQLYKDNPLYIVKSKTNIFKDYILNCREQNTSYKNNNIYQIEPDEFMRYVGYLAFFYIFSEIDVFDSDILDKICSAENNYSLSKLDTVIHSLVFQGNSFIHRTIAEFCCAWFLAHYKITADIGLTSQRIKNLFVIDNKVPTELRGTFAWLCTLSNNKELVNIDPYYQALYGDNSSFSIQQKKEIILAVNYYSKSNPYFLKFGELRDIDGLYESTMDDFILDQYAEAIVLNNHFVYFLNEVICSSNGTSSKLIEFAIKVFKRDDVKSYHKNGLIKLIAKQPSSLKILLDDITDGGIIDQDDHLKESILHEIYPGIIKPSEVVNYLKHYDQDAIGRSCLYLYETPYKDKYELIDLIHQMLVKQSLGELPFCVKGFVEDYFVETLLKFEECYSAEQIYSILKHFTSYYPPYHGLTFCAYRYAIQDQLVVNKEKLIRLTTELFSRYIDDIIVDKEFHSKYEYFNWGVEKITTEEKYNVLFQKLNEENSDDVNILLLMKMYQEMYNHISRDETILELSKKYKIEERMRKWLYPDKTELDIEWAQKKEERIKRTNSLIKQNDDYFASRSDIEIIQSFGDMQYIANLLFLDSDVRYKKIISAKTLNRLNSLLKQLPFDCKKYQSLLTIKSLASESPDARRNIDIIFYVACQQNTVESIKRITDEELLKYICISTIRIGTSINVIKGDLYNEIIENNSSNYISTLREYALLLADNYLPEFITLLEKYISQENSFKKLNTIIKIYENEKEDTSNFIIKNILDVFAFSLDSGSIIKLMRYKNINEINKATLQTLYLFKDNKKKITTREMAVSLYKLLDKENFAANFNSSKEIVKFADSLLSVFNTEESIEFHNGIQSNFDECATFLNHSLLTLLDLSELKSLLVLHNSDNDIWKKRIQHSISEKEQVEVDSQSRRLSIADAKNFILSEEIINNVDFYADFQLKLEKLRKCIEDNINNEKELFYDLSDKSRDEEYCRDVIVQKLKDRYDATLHLDKESFVANNRSDFLVCCKANMNYKVHVECKKDKNGEIYTAIKDQLIDKYLSNEVEFGIYLIFYFGYRKNKYLMMKKIKDNFPKEYQNKVSIVCIDLRRP